MKSAAVGVSLGAGGVASGTVGWCSGRRLEYGSSREDGVFGRRNNLGDG